MLFAVQHGRVQAVAAVLLFFREVGRGRALLDEPGLMQGAIRRVRGVGQPKERSSPPM